MYNTINIQGYTGRVSYADPSMEFRLDEMHETADTRLPTYMRKCVQETTVW